MILYICIGLLAIACLIAGLLLRAEFRRNAKLNIQLVQAAEQVRAAEYRANLQKEKLEQSEAARQRLRNINANLAAEKRQLEGYSQYLRGKVNRRILEELIGLALMDGPYYPRATSGTADDGGSQINLN